VAKRSRPHTIGGKARYLSLNRFDISVARGIGHLLDDHGKFRRADLIEYVGLDPKLVRDSQRVANSIQKLRRAVKAYWDEWQLSPDYMKRYGEFMADEAGFRKWMTEDSIAGKIAADYGLKEDELRDFWVQSQMWETLQDNLKAFDLYLPYSNDGMNLSRLNFWEWTIKRIKDGRQLGRGLKSVLDDFVRFGMMLPSGESPRALRARQEEMERALTDGTPLWHVCERCLEAGVDTRFVSQSELIRHVLERHPESIA
jgi:hypothetical protein